MASFAMTRLFPVGEVNTNFPVTITFYISLYSLWEDNGGIRQTNILRKSAYLVWAGQNKT